MCLFCFRTSSGTVEFDFGKDRYDVKIPSDLYESENGPYGGVSSYVPECVYSLRSYCSILYKKPRMQIIIRGQKVQSKLIAKSLAHTRKDHYTPKFLKCKRIPIIFGYNTESKEQYGIMMYHKNRLIKAYERVGCQNKANNEGVGVIGIIECNFLNPTHNKQSFDETDSYRKTIISLGIKLEEYWKEIRFKWTKENPDSIKSVEDTTKRPDQNWVQCNDCMRWRKLPDGIDCSKLPDRWFCHMNPDPQFRSCQVEEEPEDSDDDKPSYCKTYKQQEREVKKRQKTIHLPSNPTTPRSTFSTDSRQGVAPSTKSAALRPLNIAPVACSPSNDLPVISNVRSLAAAPKRGKRTQSVSQHVPCGVPPKIPREGRRSISPLRPSLGDASPLCSPSVSEKDDTRENDDDIVILEDASTPKPNNPCPALDKVKTEKEPIDSNVCLVLECSDDATMDGASEKNAARTSSTGCPAVGAEPSPAPPPMLTSSKTQTEVPKIKKEETDQNQSEGEGRADESTSNLNRTHVDAAEQSVIKQESVDQEQQTLQNIVTHHLERGEAAGPSRVDGNLPLPHPSITEVQEQQDQLLEIMEATAQERDSFKEQVNILTCQLKEMQSRLQELSRINVKVTCSDQASQTVKTEEAEGVNDYKSLFEKAKEKVDELIKDKEASLAAAKRDPSPGQGDEGDIDEIALQVDSLMRELDQRNKERDELRSQLVHLEEERANMAAQCEELRSRLQTQRENAQNTTF